MVARVVTDPQPLYWPLRGTVGCTKPADYTHIFQLQRTHIMIYIITNRYTKSPVAIPMAA